MDEVRIPKQALHWEVAGFGRRPGRPRMNWRDVVKKDLQTNVDDEFAGSWTTMYECI